jgi:hypothetical protein
MCAWCLVQHACGMALSPSVTVVQQHTHASRQQDGTVRVQLVRCRARGAGAAHKLIADRRGV